jgi:hypothetical protein
MIDRPKKAVGGGAIVALRERQSRRHVRGIAGRAVQALAVMTAVAMIGGCETVRVSSSDGRPMPPKPRPAPKAPAWAKPNRLALLVGSTIDSNGNGFPDLVHVTTVLFTQTSPSANPIAIEGQGTFIFTLHRLGEVGDPETEPIAEWRFGPETLPAARSTAMYGPCYQFRLSLLEHGTDRLPPTAADLRARFEPTEEGGESIRCSDEIRTVQIGRGT